VSPPTSIGATAFASRLPGPAPEGSRTRCVGCANTWRDEGEHSLTRGDRSRARPTREARKDRGMSRARSHVLSWSSSRRRL